MADTRKDTSSKDISTIHADRALFDGQVQGLVVALYENERPPSGLAGLMDWYFHGIISDCLRQGTIHGRIGECSYFPLTRNGTTYHLLLAGAGPAHPIGKRVPLPSQTMQVLQKNLVSLKLSKIGISLADFGQTQADLISKQLKGASVWISP